MKHLHEITTPLFAFETSISEGGVLAGAKRLIQKSKIRKYRLVADEAMGHLDPLLDFADENTFVQNVVPFLKSIASQAAG